MKGSSLLYAALVVEGEKKKSNIPQYCKKIPKREKKWYSQNLIFLGNTRRVKQNKADL